MLSRIDHVGIAVRSIEERIGFWTGGLGLETAHLEVVPTERVRVAMLPVGESRIELLEPIDETSVIARFLREKGEGIHHVCFAVDAIAPALETLRKEGYRVIEPAPRPGAGGCLVAFLHPRSAGGVLIELVELAAGGEAASHATRTAGA